MSIDLALEDEQQAIADTLRQFCADRCTPETLGAAERCTPETLGAAERCTPETLRTNDSSAIDGLWSELADMGVLGIGSIEGAGGALEMTAAMHELGAAVFPGPLVASFLAGQLLEGEELCAVGEGRLWVAAGRPPLFAWAPRAGLFLEREDDRVFRATPVGEVVPVETLGGEPWGRVATQRGAELAGGARAATFADIALAAYLAGAADRLVRDASEHARTRKQFGRSIGEFQAVSHPLADCSMRVSAATLLARSAAFQLDRGSPTEARSTSHAACLSARAAGLEAVSVCHQVFGAIGITLEGPAFHVSRRIRQLASAVALGPAREALLADALLQGGGTTSNAHSLGAA